MTVLSSALPCALMAVQWRIRGPESMGLFTDFPRALIMVGNAEWLKCWMDNRECKGGREGVAHI